MAKKKAFALRISEEMMQAIEKWAADEFRSTNGQIEYIISEALKKANRKPKPKKTEENNNPEQLITTRKIEKKKALQLQSLFR